MSDFDPANPLSYNHPDMVQKAREIHTELERFRSNGQVYNSNFPEQVAISVVVEELSRRGIIGTPATIIGTALSGNDRNGFNATDRLAYRWDRAEDALRDHLREQNVTLGDDDFREIMNAGRAIVQERAQDRYDTSQAILGAARAAREDNDRGR